MKSCACFLVTADQADQAQTVLKTTSLTQVRGFMYVRVFSLSDGEMERGINS